MDIDPTRLPDNTADNIKAMVSFVQQHLETLPPLERMIYSNIWMQMARHHVPVTPRLLKYRDDIVHTAFHRLVLNRLIWFDDDMRAVLQCPPFSALHTHHEVKAFGWERAYACSFIDAPLALLIYGPNTWLLVESTCPRSGELLRFRVQLDSDGQLQIEAPAESAQWCIWIPTVPDGHLSIEIDGTRSYTNAFNTVTDFETYQQYQPNCPPGTLYTLEQAVYVSECLLRAYQSALDKDS